MIWQMAGAFSEGLRAVGAVSGQEGGGRLDGILKHPPDFCSLALVPGGSGSCWECSLPAPDVLAPPAPSWSAG